MEMVEVDVVQVVEVVEVKVVMVISGEPQEVRCSPYELRCAI